MNQNKSSADLPFLPILCIGDLILDIFIEGEVERISPEAPIPILKKQTRHSHLGGVGNVVNNLSSLNVPTHLISVIGHDNTGQVLKNFLNVLPLCKTDLFEIPPYKTSKKTRFSSQNQQILRVDDEEMLSLTEDLQNNIQKKISQILPTVDLIILSDYGKGMISKNLCQWIIQQANILNKKTLVDPKGHDYSKYSNAFLVKPNRKELALACNTTHLSSPEAILQASHFLKEKFHWQAILTTLSDQGMCLIDAHHGIFIEAQSKEIYDVSGAGDTVIAVLAMQIQQGKCLKKAAEIANIAAGIVIEKKGTSPVLYHELSPWITSWDAYPQIIDLESLAQITTTQKQFQKKIGLANGCFDLLHLGHISLLNFAKQHCDILIIALNSDRSIKNIKGLNRPVYSETIRAKMLCSLKTVDYVTIFEDNTPYNIIKRIRPHILFKGEDYKNNEIIGQDLMEKNGGTIILAPLLDGFSTTLILNNLQG